MTDNTKKKATKKATPAPAVAAKPTAPAPAPVAAKPAAPWDSAKPKAVVAQPAPVVVTPKPAPQPVTPKAAAPAPAKAAEVKVVFAYEAPQAQHVSVYGDYDNWAGYGTPLKRQGNGRWEATITLKPGRYQYKFNVDGKWVHDPKAKENVSDGFGALNSVVEARA